VGGLVRTTGAWPDFPFAAPAEEFSPRQISGLEYWFDAQDLGTLFQDNLTTPVTAGGDPVGAWMDKAWGRHLTQATATLKPTYRSTAINTFPAVESDGVDDLLRASGVTLPQPLTVYFVGKLNATAALQRWMDGASVNLFSVLVNAGAVRRMAAPTNMDAGIVNTSPHLHTCVFNTVASSYYQDGALVGGPADIGTNSIDGLSLFAARGGGANCLSGSIGEFLLYSGAHSDAQRSQVERYLRRRWAL
jgi:hypothetical protein